MSGQLDRKTLANLFIAVFALMSIVFGGFYIVAVESHFLIPTIGILVGELVFIVGLLGFVALRLRIIREQRN